MILGKKIRDAMALLDWYFDRDNGCGDKDAANAWGIIADALNKEDTFMRQGLPLYLCDYERHGKCGDSPCCVANGGKCNATICACFAQRDENGVPICLGDETDGNPDGNKP